MLFANLHSVTRFANCFVVGVTEYDLTPRSAIFQEYHGWEQQKWALHIVGKRTQVLGVTSEAIVLTTRLPNPTFSWWSRINSSMTCLFTNPVLLLKPMLCNVIIILKTGNVFVCLMVWINHVRHEGHCMRAHFRSNQDSLQQIDNKLQHYPLFQSYAYLVLETWHETLTGNWIPNLLQMHVLG